VSRARPGLWGRTRRKSYAESEFRYPAIRSLPGNVRGRAVSDATVTMNEQPVLRQGARFLGTLIVPESTLPLDSDHWLHTEFLRAEEKAKRNKKGFWKEHSSTKAVVPDASVLGSRRESDSNEAAK